MAKPLATITLDMDNLWSYLKTHGDPEWESYPSYLEIFVPRVLKILNELNLKVTFMIVGRDAEQPINKPFLRQIAVAGHEIGNHSYDHEPWMKDATEEAIFKELVTAHRLIERATGKAAAVFRAPGFCFSPAIIRALHRLGYQCDLSLLPSILGPLGRLYYFWRARLTPGERQQRKDLFGHLSDGFRPLRPTEWLIPGGGRLVEVPVTTIPLLRTPFHLSYILWLAGFSETLAMAYFRTGLTLCRLRGVEPSYLLHPLDFLGMEDIVRLRFFPAMDQPLERKLRLARRCLGLLAERFECMPIGPYIRVLRDRGILRSMALSLEIGAASIDGQDAGNQSSAEIEA